jgi:hypothetical protein
VVEKRTGRILIVKQRLVYVEQSVLVYKVSSGKALVNLAEYGLGCALVRLKLLMGALDGSR